MSNDQENKQYDAIIIGAGVAGIAAGYYLSQIGIKVAILDKLPPLSFTSAQSGENYRNWWPHPTMTAFTNDSITLMEALSRETDNCFDMTRKGYLLASRKTNSDLLIKQLYEGYGSEGESLIRIHTKDSNTTYIPSHSVDLTPAPDWKTAITGVDVLENTALIQKHYPHLATDVSKLIHIRRAGEISFYPLAQYMLSKIREGGGRLIKGEVDQIEGGPNDSFIVHFSHDDTPQKLRAQKLINAAGPFVNNIAGMLGISLPIIHQLQQKIAFEDKHHAIPRNMPLTVDLDECLLNWSDEDRDILSSDPDTNWLTESFPGGIHCRPEGRTTGNWIKLGWAFNAKSSHPDWEPDLDPSFPDIVLRGASRLHKKLEGYLGHLPRNTHHYGGYYSMTEENWPLIGPMGPKNAYIVGGLSGFGTMAACGAGSLISRWITKDSLPSYAKNLSLERYKDKALMEKLRTLSSGAL